MTKCGTNYSIFNGCRRAAGQSLDQHSQHGRWSVSPELLKPRSLYIIPNYDNIKLPFVVVEYNATIGCDIQTSPPIILVDTSRATHYGTSSRSSSSSAGKRKL